MARPRQFDEDDVVERATRLFWRRGYHATSVRDLGSELELRPSSLYRTFTDKHALFLRALDHYRQTESAEAERRLAAAGPTPEVLRDWMVWMVREKNARGCFVVNTATELGTAHADVRQRTDAAFAVTREALTTLLRRGVATGEFPAGLDVPATAGLLFTTLLGLEVRERAGHELDELIATIDAVLAQLGLRPQA
ncbi:transcriptional regulator, TetR family [Kribbella flavida DSM 17836]|uniref:Transcriptional regulator, TetR family n=1 Tax=Kribbella flavida (strain DSM 17836 / JCM 10339 / NBRC 14399) TaxID=479435 RepID=D2PMA1_KRIFD|nr:TetR/AcrR family transcriptional regulator [Kribbella flavida]ADB34469.1 transcriptional regulator, TetR family [Kribbella flavida DSM 17836]